MNEYAILKGSECKAAELNLKSLAQPIGQPYVITGGRCVFNTMTPSVGTNEWWCYDGTAAKPLPRPPRDPNRSSPILSGDGRWVAWLEYVPGVAETPLPEQVVIRALDSDAEHIVPLPAPSGASRVLTGVEADRQTMVVFEHEYATRRNALVEYGFDGRRHRALVIGDNVEPQHNTVRQVGDGWVAWDAYREEGRYRIAWQLPTGTGAIEIPRGSGITSVAVNPAGTLLALSTSTTLNIGRVRDAVFVVRLADAHEVFRRYLPKYTRTEVAFPDDDHLVFSERVGARSELRVVRAAN